MNDEGRIQRLLACLGDPSRFRVLSVLVERDSYVTEVAERVGLSQSCTTRHLQALQREGVVHRLRAGKRVMFRIVDSDPRIMELLEWAMLRAPISGGEAGIEHRASSAAEARGEKPPAVRARGPAAARGRLPVGVRRRPLAENIPSRKSERGPQAGSPPPETEQAVEAGRHALDGNVSLPPERSTMAEGRGRAPAPGELEDYLL